MTRFAIIEAPSVLGLRPSGVELLPEAMKAAGLYQSLEAESAERIEPPPYNPRRDAETLLLNPKGLETYARQLSNAVSDLIQKDLFPVVLGGDCSNLIGCALALRRTGRYGLFFIDGHADFYQAEAEPNGEAASMDLAIVSGRGPGILTDIDGLRPLVCDEDIVAFAYRDTEDQKKYESRDIGLTSIHSYPLDQVRSLGVSGAVRKALSDLNLHGLKGLWIHLDADVLDDGVMQAVDYRIPGGLSWVDLSTVLRSIMDTGRAVGINIGIFNPRLDPDGAIARRFADCLAAGLRA